MRTLEFILVSCTLASVLIAVAIAGYFRVKSNGLSFSQYRLIVGLFAMIAGVAMLCLASLLGVK